MAGAPTIPDDLPDSSWMNRAACKYERGDVLTPAEGEEEASLRLKNNRDRLCLGKGEPSTAPCPVTESCLIWAIQTDVRTGVAGGKLWPEREKLGKRPRNRKGRAP